MKKMDCIILSGGGAKGAYGAGAALAYERYRKHNNIDNDVCYIGTSAGALNAAVCSAKGAEHLVSIWKKITNKDIIGCSKPYGMKMSLFRIWLSGKRDVCIYNNDNLVDTIKKWINYTDVVGKHLIVCASNYSKSKINPYVSSPFYDEMHRVDQSHEKEKQRLRNWRKLTTDNFNDVMLASCSIPVAFKLVQIENEYFIDGGIGNNTPIREAAYYLRYVSELGKGQPGDVYCIKLNPGRIVRDNNNYPSMLEHFARIADVYHNIHTDPIIDAWIRINREVGKFEKCIDAVCADIDSRQSIKAADKKWLHDELSKLRRGDPVTKRRSMELFKVEPSTELGSVLSFDPSTINKMILQGYQDMLNVMVHNRKITHTDHEELVNMAIG